ncbi:MAG: hypothetical protein LC725_02060, partial [Lentisphaerae bacterium]|nr:hypothetical protein [Lentisphaerota bacterium]
PCFISTRGRETFFSEGHELGSVEAILIDRHPRQWAVGGPSAPTGTIYAVINTYERPARVRLDGFGADITAAMTAYDTRVIPLRRSSWRPRTHMLEIITVATAPVPHIRYVPCLLRPAPDRETAATILQANGHLRPALHLLQDAPRSLRGDLLLYILAVGENAWTTAAQLADTADMALDHLEQALRLPPGQISVNGINGLHYNRFARIRLSHPEKHKNLMINDSIAKVPEEQPGLPPGVGLHPPVRLAQGRFNISMQVRVRADDGTTGAAKPGAFKVFDQRGRLIAAGAWRDFPDEFIAVELPVCADLEVEPRLHFTSSAPVTLEYRNLELRWTLHDRLRALHSRLLAARTRHHLQAGDLQAAARSLAGIDFQACNRHKLLRLELALRQAELADSGQLRDIAERALASAPDYWPALLIIDPLAAADRPANLSQPIVFPPWLNLVGIHHAHPGKPDEQYSLIFEALQDDTPPLTLATHRQHDKRWRRLELITDPARRRLQAGERISIPLSKTEPPDGISVMTDVRWSPGTLRTDHRQEVVPLAPLFEQTRPEP